MQQRLAMPSKPLPPVVLVCSRVLQVTTPPPPPLSPRVHPPEPLQHKRNTNCNPLLQAIPWELMSPNRPICRALSHMHCVNALEAMRLRQKSAPPGQAGAKAAAAPLAGASADCGCLQPMFFMVFSSATTDVSELQVMLWERGREAGVFAVIFAFIVDM